MNLFSLLLLLLLSIVIIAALRFAKRLSSLALRLRWILGMFAGGCLRMAQLCQHGCMRCLILVSPNRDRTDTTFLVGVAFSRMFYLTLSSIVFAALPLEILRFGHFLDFPGDGPSLGNLFVWTGLCAFLMPIIWALVLQEANGRLWEWMRIFPTSHYRTRDQWGARLMLFVAVVVTILIFYSTQCQLSSIGDAHNIALAPCEGKRPHDLVATAYFAILLITIPVGLDWSLMGLGGLAGVVLGCFSRLFVFLHFVIALVAGTILGVPQMTEADSVVTLGHTKSAHLLPAIHQYGAEHSNRDEEQMIDSRKDMTIIGFGELGSRLFPMLAQAVYALEVQGCLLGQSLVDRDRDPAATTMQVPGLDFRPQAAWMRQGLAEKSGDAVYRSFAYSINDRVVRAYQQKHSGTILVVASSSLLAELCEPLRQLKLQLPTVRLLAITIEPNDLLCDRLADAGIAIYDCQSDENLQEKAIAILGMNAAHQYSSNGQFAKVEQKLLSYAPRIAILPSSARVKGILRPRGEQLEVDFDDLLKQAKECAVHVVEEACKHHTVPVYLLFVLPLSDASQQFQEFVESMNSHLASTHPNTTAVFIRSNQPSTRGFRCGVHAVYPLADSASLPVLVPEAPISPSQSQGISRQVRISAGQ